MDGAAEREGAIFRALTRALGLAAALVVALWFLNAILGILLVFAFIAILAIALNPAVTWLEGRRVPRAAGTLLILAGIAVGAGLLGWLVVPRLVQQLADLAAALPGYVTALTDRVASALADYPEAQRRLRPDADAVGRLLPTLSGFLTRVGRYTLSAIGALVLGVVLLSAVAYLLLDPRPLLRGMLQLLPLGRREAATRAFVSGSQAVGGWLWANVIEGALEAVAAAIALSLLGVPGALVWAGLTLFAELVPKLGPYVMAVPPILVALAVDPLDALWVALFYLALNMFVGNVIDPPLRGAQMRLHPVVLLFATLAFAASFGLAGALIATPLMGFIKAFYVEFYLAHLPEDPDLDERVGRMLTRKLPNEA